MTGLAPSGTAGSAGGALGAAVGLIRVATIRPSQPSFGQSPRQVARPLGASVSTGVWHLGQAPATFRAATGCSWA